MLLLAGGNSQRMGQDKLLLKKEGISLLRRTWEIAQTLTPDVWVVTSRRDRYQIELPKAAKWIAEPPPAPNESPAGPLVAFSQALAQVNTDWVLLLACDLPNLQSNVLHRWTAELAQIPDNAIAYVPRHGDDWEPLCGFYRSSCLSSLKSYQASGQRSFQTWLDQQTVIPVLAVSPDMLANCNTPEDRNTLL
ncbi:molybdenum cofactor guanylyltransferase [Oscillatoria sp. CS-180]|uniref:molybdenum cofactor guanylyltransferase n=1 Tax=Oscillatoria sp. CS-180 TaxID=3021720 RepID=UPI00233030A8|nr:molybdenum cofactor guanylyltransferase [Oscillatoria sp. CS-180]